MFREIPYIVFALFLIFLTPASAQKISQYQRATVEDEQVPKTQKNDSHKEL